MRRVGNEFSDLKLRKFSLTQTASELLILILEKIKTIIFRLVLGKEPSAFSRQLIHEGWVSIK
jgi:hypothetical protein